MSKRQTKNYSEEFKQSSAKLAIESGQPISKIANELGICSSTLYGWIQKFSTETGAQPSSLNSPLQAELKQLRKEFARVKMERDILKKAAAYFASEAL
jgi:transposase